MEDVDGVLCATPAVLSLADVELGKELLQLIFSMGERDVLNKKSWAFSSSVNLPFAHGL